MSRLQYHWSEPAPGISAKVVMDAQTSRTRPTHRSPMSSDLRGRLNRAMRDARDRATTLVVVDEQGGETLVAHLDASCPDMVLIDLLARMHLATRRGGM